MVDIDYQYCVCHIDSLSFFKVCGSGFKCTVIPNPCKIYAVYTELDYMHLLELCVCELSCDLFLYTVTVLIELEDLHQVISGILMVSKRCGSYTLSEKEHQALTVLKEQ